MAIINYNERSWAIDVITEINFWAKDRNVILKRAGGESTLYSEEGILFPDVLLFGDFESGTILQGWELKMPDTPVDDEELIENAFKKSKALKLNSFLVWNVNSAALYKNENDDAELIYQWEEFNNNINREDVKSSKNFWKKMLYVILDDLIEFFYEKKINPSSVLDTLSESGISGLILSNSNAVAMKIKEKCQVDNKLNDEIIIWWASAKYEYSNSEKYISLAELVLVSWMNKLLFANLLKKYQAYAIKVENITKNTSLEGAINIMEDISNRCDFKNIFKTQIAENCLPDVVWSSIINFNQLLIENQINYLDNKLIQKILFNIVKKTSKSITGQFATPYNLAFFLSNLVVEDKTKNILDPCCGTGTIANACYDLKINSGIDEKDAIRTIWASDKFTFPLQLAMLSMTRPEQIGELIKIFKKDVIDLPSINDISFNDPNSGELLKIPFPKFSYILSNLPFVQQEDINKLNDKIKIEINDKIKTLTKNDGLELDGKSDLYAYIPFAFWENLDSFGKAGLITSISWLGVSWGDTFYKLLQYFFNVNIIITSKKGKWFENVDVVTTIMILEKREKNEISFLNPNSKTKYITLNVDINENEFGKNIEEICAFIRKNKDSKYFDLVEYSKLEEKKLLDVGLSKNSFFSNVKWILKIRDKLIKVNEIFDVKRGERRGWDDLFYPQGNHNIEKEYLKKVLKSSRDIEKYVATPNSDAFCCEKSIEELKSRHHVYTLSWIKKFENKVNTVGKPLPEALKKSNTYWYSMKSENIADLSISVNPGDRLFFIRLKERSFINQRLIGFIKKEEDVNIKICAALLNSLIGLFYIEASGFGRGLGALDLNATNLKNRMCMLNPSLLSENDIAKIIFDYEIMEKRDVYDLNKELLSDDRKKFDLRVLKAFGIEEYYDEIQDSLLNIYNRRISVKD